MKGWQSKPYWLKGGILALPAYLVLAPFSIFIGVSFGASDDIIQLLAPEFFFGAWALAAMGDSSTVQMAYSLGILLGVLLARLFLLGAVLGAVYGWFAKYDKARYAVLLFIVLYLAGMGYITYKYQDLWRTYSSVTTVEGCDDASKKFVNNFNENECYRKLAVKNLDVSLCDKIDRTTNDGKSGNDYVAFCYEEVAHAKNDPGICALIDAESFNEHGTLMYRRDSCYSWFKMCEKVSNPIERDACWTRVARIRQDPALCNNVEGTHAAFTRDKCLQEVATRQQQ